MQTHAYVAVSGSAETETDAVEKDSATQNRKYKKDDKIRTIRFFINSIIQAKTVRILPNCERVWKIL